MSSILIKFFAGMIAMMIAHRIISIIFTVIIAFFLYKYITDPKYIPNLIKNIKETTDIFGGMEFPKVESAKETAKNFL